MFYARWTPDLHLETSERALRVLCVVRQAAPVTICRPPADKNLIALLLHPHKAPRTTQRARVNVRVACACVSAYENNAPLAEA